MMSKWEDIGKWNYDLYFISFDSHVKSDRQRIHDFEPSDSCKTKLAPASHFYDDAYYWQHILQDVSTISLAMATSSPTNHSATRKQPFCARHRTNCAVDNDELILHDIMHNQALNRQRILPDQRTAIDVSLLDAISGHFIVILMAVWLIFPYLTKRISSNIEQQFSISARLSSNNKRIMCLSTRIVKTVESWIYLDISITSTSFQGSSFQTHNSKKFGKSYILSSKIACYKLVSYILEQKNRIKIHWIATYRSYKILSFPSSHVTISVSVTLHWKLSPSVCYVGYVDNTTNKWRQPTSCSFWKMAQCDQWQRLLVISARINYIIITITTILQYPPK